MTSRTRSGPGRRSLPGDGFASGPEFWRPFPAGLSGFRRVWFFLVFNEGEIITQSYTVSFAKSLSWCAGARGEGWPRRGSCAGLLCNPPCVTSSLAKFARNRYGSFLRGTLVATSSLTAPGRIEGNYEMRSSPISLPPATLSWSSSLVPEEGKFREAKHNKMVYL